MSGGLLAGLVVPGPGVGPDGRAACAGPGQSRGLRRAPGAEEGLGTKRMDRADFRDALGAIDVQVPRMAPADFRDALGAIDPRPRTPLSAGWSRHDSTGRLPGPRGSLVDGLSRCHWPSGLRPRRSCLARCQRPGAPPARVVHKPVPHPGPERSGGKGCGTGGAGPALDWSAAQGSVGPGKRRIPSRKPTPAELAQVGAGWTRRSVAVTACPP